MILNALYSFNIRLVLFLLFFNLYFGAYFFETKYMCKCSVLVINSNRFLLLFYYLTKDLVSSFEMLPLSFLCIFFMRIMHRVILFVTVYSRLCVILIGIRMGLFAQKI